MEKIIVNAEIDVDKLEGIMNQYGITGLNEPLNTVSELCDNHNITVMKSMSNALCSDEIIQYDFSADCKTQISRKDIGAGNARVHVANVNILVEAKTIYNIKHKTKQQITDILLEVERQFLELHHGYRYDNYRYEDGKYGERQVFLMFKPIACSNPS